MERRSGPRPPPRRGARSDSDSGAVDVVVTGGSGRGRDGIGVHRHPASPKPSSPPTAASPPPRPARTILGLAATAPDRRLRHALDHAEHQELTDHPARDALARAHPGHRGSTRLTTAPRDVRGRRGPHQTGLQVAFLELCERHRLPRPLVNHELLPAHTVDLLFAEQRLAVETDSWRRHRGRAAFERDRQRDAALAAIGHRTLRLTDRHIEHAPATVARAIVGALDAGAGQPDKRPWPEPESAAVRPSPT